jgi:hypothetical protein
VGEIEMGDLTAYFKSDEILSLKDKPFFWELLMV